MIKLSLSGDAVISPASLTPSRLFGDGKSPFLLDGILFADSRSLAPDPQSPTPDPQPLVPAPADPVSAERRIENEHNY